ncbi:MAG: hypothetical protein QG575_1182, partial [Euryarchaeota archaeon]|nr:hypothetical protein [Euryarchaeota archaeon]
MRLAWPPPRHLMVSVLISLVALALVHLSPSSLQEILSSFALILVFLIPGYLAALSIFPGKSDLSGIRRAFLCLASSAMIAGLFSLILTATPRGLQSASLATLLSLLAIFLAAVAYGRWSNLPRKRRFLLMPKRGLGSTRPIPRAALAILLLAACFIAALAFAFGPYQFPSEEASANIEATTSGEALTTPSPSSEEEKEQIKSYPPQEEESPVVDLSQNNSGNASIINSTGLNNTINKSPENLEDMSEATFFSMGGGGGGGSTGGGSSSSSSQTVAKKPASSKALQPEKAVSTSPTAASAPVSNVQNNTSVAAANLSNTSLTSQDNQTRKGNLTEIPNLTEASNQTIEDNAPAPLKDTPTLDRAVLPVIEPAANPAPMVSSSIAANETKAARVENLTPVQAPTVPVSALSLDKNISSKSTASEQSIVLNESTSSFKEGSSIESDLSRAIRQYESEPAKSNGEGLENSNRPPVLKALVPDRASPQQLGAAIFWKAEATDEEGDKILYRFFLDGREVRKWSKINSWSWLSQGLPAGDYQITVLAIDGNHAGQDSFDS